MPRGDKSSYTAKQKREARHIEQSYEQRGVSAKESARRAWATVNRQDGGGRKAAATKKTAARKRPPATKSATKKATSKHAVAKKTGSRRGTA